MSLYEQILAKIDDYIGRLAEPGMPTRDASAYSNFFDNDLPPWEYGGVGDGGGSNHSHDFYGPPPDPADVRMEIAILLLSLVQQNGARLADGQIGVDGDQWPDLSPKTKAYGRRIGATEKVPGHGVGGKDGVLTKDQQEKWYEVYRKVVAWQIAEGRSVEEAKRVAAAHAWKKIRAEGARTKLEVYGDRKLQILRDTGALFSSFDVDVSDGNISVGPNVHYARYHHYGTRHLPRRRLWPETMPVTWQAEINEIAAEAIAHGLENELGEIRLQAGG